MEDSPEEVIANDKLAMKSRRKKTCISLYKYVTPVIMGAGFRRGRYEVET